MNTFQGLWWQQAKSDHQVFQRLRSEGVAQCHSLHYLQMVTEKLAKAYFWRSGSPRRKVTPDSFNSFDSWATSDKTTGSESRFCSCSKGSRTSKTGFGRFFRLPTSWNA